MTTTVPCRGVSIIYIIIQCTCSIYNVHVQHSHQRSRVCVHVSGCELIPERRGRREREGLG